MPAEATLKNRVAGAAILAALLILGACSFNYGGPAGAQGRSPPDAVFHDFVHTVMEDGSRALELKADLAESYQSEGLFVLRGVDFTQFDRITGQVSAKGRADSATFHTESEDAELSGHISLSSVTEDASLQAESLSWDGKAKLLQGGLDRTVEVRKGDGTWVRGAGFISDTRRRSFTFREAVEGRLVAKEGGAAGDTVPGAGP